MKPRQYQLDAYNATREAFKQGHKHICICMSGGAGKSLLSKMILDAGAQKGSKLGFFSFRKSLTEQIKKYNIPNCDIGTLQKFGKTETEEYDLVIYDEKDYHDTKLKNNIKSKYSITLSGFPTDADGYVLDYDYIVEAIQYPELVSLGYAKPVRVLSTSKIDTSRLKKHGGDFNKQQSFDLMEKSTIKKDIIDTYKKYCLNRKSLLFAIDTKHAESLKQEFLANGIKCETIHSKKSDDGIIEAFERDDFDLLINVAMISIGVDIPCINAIIFARPMCSVPLMMQCVWRGTRKFNDDDCLVIDCAEVLKRTGFHPMQKLDLHKKKSNKKQKQCKCGGDLKIIGKEIKPIDEMMYLQITKYKCDLCNAYAESEDYKTVNYSFCESCGEVLEVGNITYRQTEKAIEFIRTCKCGYESVERDILLTDAELKEIKLEQTMSSISWDRVYEELKIECKRCNYKWQFSQRMLEMLKGRGKTPEQSLDMIMLIRENGHKLAKLQFME